jgi:cytidylate kinase
MIITISRQFAAGGSEVARRVAEALAWRVVDNELIDRVAARTGLPPEAVAQREERAPGFIERLTRVLTRAVPELFPKASETVPEPEEAALVRVTESVVAELAAEGRVVLVGRAGPAILRGGASHDALHVKLVAATPIRLAAAMARLGLDRKEAEGVLRETDANRSRYLKQHYGRDWEDPANYDLILNTGSLGLDGAAEIIVGCARGRWPVSGER